MLNDVVGKSVEERLASLEKQVVNLRYYASVDLSSVISRIAEVESRVLALEAKLHKEVSNGK